MTTMIEAILQLRPGLDPAADFMVVDRSDGSGAFLMSWLNDTPRPSDEEIAAAMMQQPS